MPRQPLIRTNIHPYHVYNRVNSKRAYPSEYMNEIWRCYCDCLCILTWVYGVRVHAFVLMANHYHLIISTPDANLDTAMLYLQREVSRFLSELTRTQDYRFQARYKKKLIENELQFTNTFRYVARNPASVNVVECPLQYPFSTFSGQFGATRLICPIYECQLFSGVLPEEIFEREFWITHQKDPLGTG